MPPPPRESRLHKAALTLLVAASAAFFVCAQASAIQITSSSPSEYQVNVLEDSNTEFTVETDVDFERVEWKLRHPWSFSYQEEYTHDGDDDSINTTSSFTPNLDGIGAPWGSLRYIEVTVFDANGASDFTGFNVMVWKGSNKLPIDITDKGGPSDILVDETFTVWLKTTIGFDRVDWYIDDADEDDVPVDTTYGPDFRASFTHTFQEGDGSDRENGEPYKIIAKAYAIGSSYRNVEEFDINVHEGKGKILRDTFAYIDYFYVEMNADQRSALVDIGFSAGIYYYNDLEEADAHIYAFVLACQRQRNAHGVLMEQRAGRDSFKVFHAPNNVEGEKWILPLERGFDRVSGGSFELEDALFVEGTEELPNFYYAYTKAEVLQDKDEWKYRFEDKSGDGTIGKTDTDETMSREFSKEWFEGFNPP